MIIRLDENGEVVTTRICADQIFKDIINNIMPVYDIMCDIVYDTFNSAHYILYYDDILFQNRRRILVL